MSAKFNLNVRVDEQAVHLAVDVLDGHLEAVEAPDNNNINNDGNSH